MKNNTDYQLYNQAFLRTPVYSFSRYDPDRIPELLGTALFRNALWLASPAFFEELHKKGFEFSALNKKERFTLLKYYNRMCFRPTPFGLFAAFTIVGWGDADDLRLAADTGLLLGILPPLRAMTDNKISPLIEERSRIRCNPTLYRAGNEWRFIRSTPDEERKVSFSIGATPASRLLNTIIERYGKGEHGSQELQEFISAITEIPAEDAKAFIADLLNIQLFLSESRGAVITPELPFRISAIAADLPQQLAGSGINGGREGYAVTERPRLSGTLLVADGERLAAAANLLARLATAPQETTMDRFAKAFTARFGQQRIPLAEALDPDRGINYEGLAQGAGLPETIDQMGRTANKENGHTQLWTAVHRLLFRLIGEANACGPGTAVVIQPEMAAELTVQEKTLPPVISVLYRKASGTLVIEHAGGSSPAALIARFSPFSADAANLGKALGALEGNLHPGTVFADISQMSDLYIDNISRRTALYAYQIDINTFPVAGNAWSISPSELLVSCVNGEVILESSRLKKRVIPRLNSAFNYQRNNLSIFRFLCDLQHQGLTADLSLDPGQLFPGMSYYPRIKVLDLIVSPARWHLDKPALEAVQGGGSVSAFRERHRLPAQVTAGAHDQRLVFDLDNPADVQFFIDYMKGKSEVVLEEYLAPCKSIKSGSRPLAAQGLAFLHHQQAIYRPVKATSLKAGCSVGRTFPPGSEWLFLKIYCTEESTNIVLAELIAPFLRKNGKVIKKWFFIRYADDRPHLRLRLNIAPADSGTLLQQFKKTVAGSAVQSYVADVYDRELERYGQFTVLAEDIFHRSSVLVTRLVVDRQGGKKTWTEFQSGLYLTAMLLAVMTADDHEALSLCASLAETLLKEMGGAKKLKVMLDQDFRAARAAIAELLFPGATTSWQLGAIARDLRKSMELLKGKSAGLTHPLRDQLTADIAHMHLNRTFRFEPRKQELIVWHCLQRYLSALEAQHIGSSWRLAFTEKKRGT